MFFSIKINFAIHDLYVQPIAPKLGQFNSPGSEFMSKYDKIAKIFYTMSKNVIKECRSWFGIDSAVTLVNVSWCKCSC